MLPQATVMIILNKDDEVLLLQRHPTHALFPDEWCLPGGKIDRTNDQIGHMKFSEYIETPEESIYRECKEELGIKIYAFQNRGLTLMDDHYHMHVFHALGVYTYSDITKVFPNREHVRFGWFSKRELPKLLSGVTRQLLLNIDL